MMDQNLSRDLSKFILFYFFEIKATEAEKGEYYQAYLRIGSKLASTKKLISCLSDSPSAPALINCVK